MTHKELCIFGTSKWKNPHDIMAVKCSASSVGNGTVQSLVGDANAPDFFTKNEPSSWCQIELNYNHQVIPNHYTLSLSHRKNSLSFHKPRNWVLEGRSSKDGKWLTLSTHVNDMSFGAEGKLFKSAVSWPILSCDIPVDAFRIRQTGPTSGFANYLIIKGFEVYGFLERADN